MSIDLDAMSRDGDVTNPMSSLEEVLQVDHMARDAAWAQIEQAERRT